ncbi:MAG: hypothetical protein AB7O49_17625 [Sphingomonadales bacterium]
MGVFQFIATTRLALAAFRHAKPIARRLSFRLMVLFASACVTIGAIASLFWALYEVLYRFVGPGWSAIATSAILWLVAWAMWEFAWNMPIRPCPRHRRHPRRPTRRLGSRSRN